MAAEKKFSGSFSLTEEIAGIIRDRILKGEYTIGEKIIETQIADELLVSRTPVREAFKQLEKEGLMEYVHNKGYFARGFTKQDMQDIYSVRKAMEQLSVEWAIHRITDEELEALKDYYDLMDFYTRRKNCQKVSEINKEFHDTIYSSTRSRFMAQILRSYQDYVEQARKATVYEEENLEDILKEHKKILDAIRERNVDAAVQRIGEHLDNSRYRAEAKWGIQ